MDENIPFVHCQIHSLTTDQNKMASEKGRNYGVMYIRC